MSETSEDRGASGGLSGFDARAELTVALAAAAAGAAELQRRYRPGGVRDTAASKGQRRNLVTDADRASEAAVLAVLAALRPDDVVMAEESAPEALAESRYWCVDPLDGTNNFAQGIPLFCVSVALVIDGLPRVGVIHAPLLGEVHSTDGAQVLLNGESIAVSDTSEVADAIFATGFAYDRENLPDDNTENFRSVLMACRGMRRGGSAAHDLAWVACGRLDGFWELWLNPWDLAAGAALVRAAGGHVTDMAGGGAWLCGAHIAATNGRLHDELLSLLQDPPNA
jgi:myo-inositol-1(or 4)-monophosphatase